MQIDPGQISEREQYKLMSGAIVPRPIALVTTLGKHGVNAAPFSLFNIAGTEPPMVYVCAGDQDDGSEKDTVQNLRFNPEFVVHIVNEKIADRMNTCATDFPIDVNELEKAGLAAERSVKVSPPRISESPAQFECRLLKLIDIGSRHHIIIGEVVLFHFHDGIVNDRFHVDFRKLNPIGRLSGSLYARLNETFELERPYLNAK